MKISVNMFLVFKMHESVSWNLDKNIFRFTSSYCIAIVTVKCYKIGTKFQKIPHDVYIGKSWPSIHIYI